MTTLTSAVPDLKILKHKTQHNKHLKLIRKIELNLKCLEVFEKQVLYIFKYGKVGKYLRVTLRFHIEISLSTKH